MHAARYRNFLYQTFKEEFLCHTVHTQNALAVEKLQKESRKLKKNLAIEIWKTATAFRNRIAALAVVQGARRKSHVK